MKMLVEITGVPAVIMEDLIKTGIFKTKSEVIRAGIMKLGNEYYPLIIKPITDKKALNKIRQVEADVRKGKKRWLSEKEALAPYKNILKKISK